MWEEEIDKMNTLKDKLFTISKCLDIIGSTLITEGFLFKSLKF